MTKKIIFILLILVVMTGLTFAGGDNEESAKLIVGTSAGFRPFEYREMGEVTGFDIAIMEKIAEKLGMTLEVRDMDFDALIEAVDTGVVDVVAAGMTITEERKERVDFTVHYFIADQSVLIRKDSDIVIGSIDEINNAGSIIGVQNDTTGHYWVLDNLPDATLKEYGKYIECIQDLENLNIDMIVLDKPVAIAYEQNRDVKVAKVIETDEKYGLAIKKESALYESINSALQELMSSPEWDELLTKYFGAAE